MVDISEDMSGEIPVSLKDGAILVKQAGSEFRHKAIAERLEAYYGKPVGEIEPIEEEEVDWGGRYGDEAL